MVLLGCTPEGRLTEQHDIYFDIGADLKSLVPNLKKFWPDSGKLHVDGWRPVTQVDSWQVSVISRPAETGPAAQAAPSAQPGQSSHRLFFINLGGYKPNEFDEFHYKMLVAAPEKGEAIRKAKETAFYRHTGFKGAESHIDDKYGVDVDDIYDIQDILPEAVKEKYRLHLTPAVSDSPDPVSLGYFQLHKL
jgi:hypothetical protein